MLLTSPFEWRTHQRRLSLSSRRHAKCQFPEEGKIYPIIFVVFLRSESLIQPPISYKYLNNRKSERLKSNFIGKFNLQVLSHSLSVFLSHSMFVHLSLASMLKRKHWGSLLQSSILYLLCIVVFSASSISRSFSSVKLFLAGPEYQIPRYWRSTWLQTQLFLAYETL